MQGRAPGTAEIAASSARSCPPTTPYSGPRVIVAVRADWWATSPPAWLS
ncbi:hypothetical protein [Streptomyces sp. NBC_01361]|nr:hypothetical protein [Streptomyces sp. NBC_01361]